MVGRRGNIDLMEKGMRRETWKSVWRWMRTINSRWALGEGATENLTDGSEHLTTHLGVEEYTQRERRNNS